MRSAGERSSSVGVIPTAGGEPREVFRGQPWLGNSRYGTLAWTADQRYLLFTRPEGAQNNPLVGGPLWRVPVTGGAPEKMGISVPGQLRSPRVHPDGRRLTLRSR